MHFLLVFFGEGEEPLIEDIRPLTNHSADSIRDQTMSRFEGTSVSALRLVTFFFHIAVLIKVMFKKMDMNKIPHHISSGTASPQKN